MIDKTWREAYSGVDNFHAGRIEKLASYFDNQPTYIHCDILNKPAFWVNERCIVISALVQILKIEN